MSHEISRWDRVKRIFHEALDRAPADRPAFLMAVCGDDAELRASVERLLAANDQSGLLDDSAMAVAVSLIGPPSNVLRSGDQLGAYRIDAFVGAGGMGVVYRALDTKLHRPVAIKILSSVSGQTTRHLLNEARTGRSAEPSLHLHRP